MEANSSLNYWVTLHLQSHLPTWPPNYFPVITHRNGMTYDLQYFTQAFTIKPTNIRQHQVVREHTAGILDHAY